jgi:uncharacterized RDD family membrane protein YckC
MEPMRDVSPVEAADEPDLADWDVRTSAWLLDVLIVWGVGLAIGLTFAIASGGDAEAAGYGTALVLRLLVAPLYSTFFHAGPRGQTLGKRAAGIRVQREDGAERLGLGRSFGRSYMTTLFWVALSIPAILDGLWPLWDKRRQTWHDKVAGTLVVKAL